MKQDFKSKEDIRTEVSIVDYALLNGYKINKQESTTNWVKLINTSTGDKVLVKTNVNLYSSLVGNYNDKGDVLQFTANRLNGSVLVDKSNVAFYTALKNLNAFIGNHLNEKNPIITEKEKYFEKKKTLLSIQGQNWNQISITDYSFLTQKRAIDINILKLPLFENKLYNTFFSLENGHIITNVAFSKTIKDKLVGLEVRNTKTKTILGDDAGVFYTNYNKEKKVDGVLYAESGIDIASFIEVMHQNPKFDKSKNYCFLSFSGNLYKSKCDTILEDLEKMNLSKNCSFVSLTDVDFDKKEENKAGKAYDVLFTSSLINKFITPLTYDVNDTYYKYTFTKKEDLDLVKIKNLFLEQASFVDKEFDINNRFGKYVVVKENHESLEIHFPKKIPLEQTYFQQFLETIKAQNLYKPNKIYDLAYNVEKGKLTKLKNNKEIQKGDIRIKLNDWNEYLMITKNFLPELEYDLKDNSVKFAVEKKTPEELKIKIKTLKQLQPEIDKILKKKNEQTTTKIKTHAKRI